MCSIMKFERTQSSPEQAGLVMVVNPLWGSPRILGELKKLGIDVAKSTVEKYMIRTPKPPSQAWRTFFKNHMSELVSIDFLVVPTVRFKVLFVVCCSLT